jgi:hypothetical protein
LLGGQNNVFPGSTRVQALKASESCQNCKKIKKKNKKKKCKLTAENRGGSVARMLPFLLYQWLHHTISGTEFTELRV